MKIVQINATSGVGSTGKICVEISKILQEQNIENYIICSGSHVGHSSEICFGNKLYYKFQALKARVIGNYGFNSNYVTKRIISSLREIQPDIVHLHNVHGHNCNIETLLKYLKEAGTKVIWTFHDCWAFTGYCTHFDMLGCNKWKTQCKECIQRKMYSWFSDDSEKNYQRKKNATKDLDLTIVTPSQWLSNLVADSFLHMYQTKVIKNGIDLSVFKPINGHFRERYGLDEKKKIILGVSFEWKYRKGLDVFLKLAEDLDKNTYAIVLVGTNESVDKQLPSSIISIHRTRNQRELAEIYTVADVFVNPTREDNYPTVNMEAIACSTPVITFNAGGSGEMIDSSVGVVVEKNDYKTLYNAIIQVCNKHYDENDFIKKRKEYDSNSCFKEYLRLYIGDK